MSAMLPIMPQKLALLGGTFDPPHLGHLTIAEWVQQALALDQVIFIPAGSPPHKQHLLTPAQQRLEMLQAAIADNPRFSLSTLELERSGPSYTLLTLQDFRAQWPQAEIWWVLGLDSLLNLHHWHRYHEFPAYARLAVTPRPGQTLQSEATVTAHIQDYLPEFTDQIDWINMPLLDISSSALRKWIQNQKTGRYLLHPAVWQYIKEHGLYRPNSEIC